MHFLFYTRSLSFILYVCCCGIAATGQSISLSTGAPLASAYCHEDKNYGLTGYPSGGTFAGCGVFQQNGQWYFNPKIAAEAAAVFPHVCELEYIRNGATIVSRNIIINKPVTIHPPLQDTFTCDGSFILYAETLYAGDYDYVWTPESGLANPKEHQTAGILETAQKFVVTATDILSGCSGSDSMTVTNQSLNLDIDLDKDRICPGDKFHLTINNHTPGNRYQWYYPGNGNPVSGTEATFSDWLTLPGKHAIHLIASNDKCTDSASATVEVIEVGLKLHASPSSVHQGTSIRMSTEALLPYTVTAWLPGYLFANQAATTQHIIPDSSRTYAVVAITEEGCIDTAFTEVKVNPILFFPNAFSPNGDGINDYFKPVSGGDDIIVGWLQIFNRHGHMIYESNGGLLGNISGWDGNYQGKPADVGTYYYYARLSTKTGGYYEFKGDVLLIR